MARIPYLAAVIGLALALTTLPATAAVSAKDDAGQTIMLAGPAKRIVSLAPHITETLFAIGAGDRLVGAVQYSDYPEAARKIPRIGSYAQFDLEAIAALRADLVVGWSSGNPPAQLEKLRSLGLTLYLTDPHHLPDIPATLERLGALVGTDTQAARSAADFRRRYARLQAARQGRKPVRAFYEIWNRPLMTINGQHLISDVMQLCGAENVFARLPALTPTLDEEAVLAADPDMIIASGMDQARPEWLDDWRKWPRLKAVRAGNLYFIPPDIIQRHSPRIIEGAERLCGMVEEVRGKR